MDEEGVIPKNRIEPTVGCVSSKLSHEDFTLDAGFHLFDTISNSKLRRENGLSSF